MVKEKQAEETPKVTEKKEQLNWGVYDYPIKTEQRVLNKEGNVFTVQEALAILIEKVEKLEKGLLG